MCCGLVRLLVVATCVVGHSGPKLAIVYWRPGQLALEPKMQPHKEVDKVFFWVRVWSGYHGKCVRAMLLRVASKTLYCITMFRRKANEQEFQ